MRRTNIMAVVATGIMLMLTSCGGNAVEKQAEEALREAREMADRGEYIEAKAAIDSLRKNYPEAIETRRKALALYQEVELKRAELIVATTDSALQRVDGEYRAMKRTVDSLRNIGKATEQQLRAANLMRVRRDSLQAAFDVECAKIKYIKKKMSENK